MVQRFMATQDTRQREVDRNGSPNFLHRFGVLAATTGTEMVTIQRNFDGRGLKWGQAFSYCVLTNYSDENLDIYINGIDWGPSAAGTVIIIADESIITFELRNLEATATSANEVRGQFSIPPKTQDMVARGGR